MTDNKKLKVLMAAAEVAPFAKVGGLADVVGSLPPALKKLNLDVRVVMPKYGTIDEKKYKLKKIFFNIEIPTAGKTEKINIWESKLPESEVTIYFIDNKKHFSKKEVYFGNNAERFAFFSLACVHFLEDIGFKPDVFHCHDFHTALITNIIKASKLYSAHFRNLKTLYTIHNLNYQGKSEIELLSTGNLKEDMSKNLIKDAEDGDINFMVQGILNSDAVNTVSKTYSKEIALKSYGAGLEKIIKANKTKISGILNGIDVDFFNPETDKFIKKNYSAKNVKNKIKNKVHLQRLLNLPQNKEIAVVSLISRLAHQKGLELIDEELIASSDCQFVFLGTGQKEYEDQLRNLQKKYPDKVSANIMFDVGLAQQIYAGSDMFLMPSRFEPCGLGQMIAMRYGTVTVARATGGLDDTINSTNGFKFKEFRPVALKRELLKALNVYYKKKSVWNRLMKKCITSDFSWNKSAKEYLKIYKRLLK
jgi:starch synthase